MKLRKSGGPNLPDWQRSRSLRNLFYAHEWRGQLVARTWPRKRGKPTSNRTRQQNQLFAATVKAIADVAEEEREAAEYLARGTAYTWRDILFMSMHGEYIEIEGLIPVSIQDLLDTITDVPGSILYRNDDLWIGLVPPTADAILAFDIATHKPVWVDPAYRGISELTGDITAGPGGGTQAATLAASGVVAGTYTNANITVDAKGRVTEAENGTDSAGITQLGGDVTAGPGSGLQTTTLSATGVVAGSYGHASITVDAAGRITDADVGAVATTSVAGTVIPDGTTIDVDGSGVISVIGGGGGGGGDFTKISRQAASNTATLDWTGLSGTPEQGYALVGRLLIPVSGSQNLWLRFGTGATPTWQTASYAWARQLFGTGGFTANRNGESASAFVLTDNDVDGSSIGVNFNITIISSVILGTITYKSNDGHYYTERIGGRWVSGTAITAFRLLFSSGNISSGEATLYSMTS